MMATKQKAAASVEEQPKAVETAQEAPQTARETQEQSQDIQEGVNLEETPVGGISDEIVVVSAAGGLNLRTGPARSYPVAELLEDGTLLAALELPHGAEVPGWALVHTGQRTGWVDRRFIRRWRERRRRKSWS